MQQHTHTLVQPIRIATPNTKHPYLLGVPMVGSDQYGHITRAFLGPHGGERSKWQHQPCLLEVPVVGRNQPRKEWMWWT